MTLVARTALLLPFSWEQSPERVAAALVMRTVRNEARRLPAVQPREERFWLEVDRRPRELGELDPAFRSMLDGVRGDSVRHLALSREARQALARPVLETSKGEPVFPGPTIDHVDLFLLDPYAAVLVLRLDWADEAGVVPAPADLVERLDRIRHTRREEGRSNIPGWTFAPYAEVSESAAAHNLVPAGATRGEGGIGLAQLADWLLALPDEVAAPPPRAAPSRYVRHQTVVVLEEQPEKPALEALLFRLTRAVGPKYLAPAGSGGVAVLEPYGNYRIGLAREGIAALSWSTGEGNAEFDLKQWPAKMVGGATPKKGTWPGLPGIYLMLTVQVLLERETLLSHSRQASDWAADLDQRKMAAARRAELFGLVRDSVRFRAAASFSDCGGITAYSDFHSGVSDRLDVPGLRAEVAGKLAELFHLSDLSHRFEEERRADVAAGRQERVDRAIALFGTPVAVATILALPALKTVLPNLPWILGLCLVCVMLGYLISPVLRWFLARGTREPPPSSQG